MRMTAIYIIGMVILTNLLVDVAVMSIIIAFLCWCFSVAFTFKYVIGSLVLARILVGIARSKRK